MDWLFRGPNLRLVRAMLLLVICVLAYLPVSDGSECMLQPTASLAGIQTCLGMTKCYLDYLGEPTTPAEWWMAYASAVTEYCTSLGANWACSNETGLCKVMYITPVGHYKGVPMSYDRARQFVDIAGEDPPTECWPNWEKIIRHPCIGCKDYQMFRCADTAEQDACDALDYCTYWPKSGRSSCWPKWLLDYMFTNKTALNMTESRGGPVPNPPHTTYYYDRLFGSDLDCSYSFWNVEPRLTDGLCGHKKAIDAFLSSVPFARGSELEMDLSMPYMHGGRAERMWPWPFDYYQSAQVEKWPYYSRSCERSSHQTVYRYDYVDFLYMHEQLSAPWTNLQTDLEPHSAWKDKLAMTSGVCLNGTNTPGSVTAINATNCGLKQSSQNTDAIMHILLQYCDVALNSSCNVAEFSNVTFTDECQVSNGPRLALGAIWLIFGILMLLAVIILTLLWTSPNSVVCCTLTRVGSFRHWLLRAPVSYHPQTTVTGPRQAIAHNVSSPHHGVPAWKRLMRRVYRVALVIVYIADIFLDIWAFATLCSFSATSPYLIIGKDLAVSYGLLMLCAFGVQFLIGAFLAAPAVFATFGLLDYSWFKMTPTLRTVLMLPPTWIVIICGVGLVTPALLPVSLWYLLLADVNMLLSLLGVPPKWLLGNRLNIQAVVPLRFFCEGLIEALPSALISTAIINSILSRGQPLGAYYMIFWLNLLSSLARVATELYKVLRLTHDLNARCFVTAIVDICYHLQPHTSPSLPTSCTQGVPSPTTGLVNQQPQIRRGVACAGTQQPSNPASKRGWVAGCCGPTFSASNIEHPKALKLYVWVVTSAAFAYMLILCMYLVCPAMFKYWPYGNGVCGVDGLVAVWSSFNPIVEIPGAQVTRALACLKKVGTNIA